MNSRALLAINKKAKSPRVDIAGVSQSNEDLWALNYKGVQSKLERMRWVIGRRLLLGETLW